VLLAAAEAAEQDARVAHQRDPERIQLRAGQAEQKPRPPRRVHVVRGRRHRVGHALNRGAHQFLEQPRQGRQGPLQEDQGRRQDPCGPPRGQPRPLNNHNNYVYTLGH